MTRSYTILLALTAVFLTSSCTKQKGCTDKKALNYSVVAEENDGSCTYCNEKKTLTGYAEEFLVDNNFSSNFYNQNVVKFIIYQVKDTYNDQGCGETTCHLDFDMVNLTNKKITFSYSGSAANGNIFFSTSSSTPIIIAPGDTVSTPYKVSSSQNSFICTSTVSSSNTSVQPSSTISYE